MADKPNWIRDSALLNALMRNTYNAMSPNERTELLIKRDIEIDDLKHKLAAPVPAQEGE